MTGGFPCTHAEPKQLEAVPVATFASPHSCLSSPILAVLPARLLAANIIRIMTASLHFPLSLPSASQLQCGHSWKMDVSNTAPLCLALALPLLLAAALPAPGELCWGWTASSCAPVAAGRWGVGEREYEEPEAAWMQFAAPQLQHSSSLAGS